LVFYALVKNSKASARNRRAALPFQKPEFAKAGALPLQKPGLATADAVGRRPVTTGARKNIPVLKSSGLDRRRGFLGGRRLFQSSGLRGVNPQYFCRQRSSNYSGRRLKRFPNLEPARPQPDPNKPNPWFKRLDQSRGY
jgi:hypothetical protein